MLDDWRVLQGKMRHLREPSALERRLRPLQVLLWPKPRLPQQLLRHGRSSLDLRMSCTFSTAITRRAARA
jgi:hypothetical protein